MNLSYWENKTWFSDIDFTVVGSGIVGLNCALSLRKRFPKSRILVVEKGIIPTGASTKNAGFACFGSLSEIIADLSSHSEEEVFDLVKKKWNGLNLLRKNIGDKKLNFFQHGGYELFENKDRQLLDECLEKQEVVNKLLKPVFDAQVFSTAKNTFSFKKIEDTVIYNRFEGQLDTGKMMQALLNQAAKQTIMVLNSAEITSFADGSEKVNFSINNQLELSTKKLLIATNGFARQLVNEDVKPARAQVLITKPIKNLHIKGTFHLDEGFYYFRNIDNRILLGGGRNLDIKTEETTTFGLTETIQNKLEVLLKETILPNTNHEIEARWSGIMGTGNKKQPIVKQLSNNVYCGIRLGGMGVAIGSCIGEELAGLV